MPQKSAPYTDEQKKEVVRFVNTYNTDHGRGGQSEAAKKFGVPPLMIAAWLKARSAKTPLETLADQTDKQRRSQAAATAEVTTEAPRDPAWDAVRQTSEQLRAVGRLWLRGQVRLGMQLAALKKQLGIRAGKHVSSLPDSGKEPSWADRVKQETGYSRQSCDEFIRLYEATVTKLKKAKKLDLPASVKKSALVLFQDNTSLKLTDEQWSLVDDVIGTLTTGETQASLMQELKLVPAPPKMPKKTGVKDDGESDEETAGQLAFHFFSGVASPLMNARTSPDYKAMLMALPVDSDADHPLSLSTLEAEFRAALAEVVEAKQANAKPARGRAIA